MKKSLKIIIIAAICLVVALGTAVTLAFVFRPSPEADEEQPAYEPAPPEAPRLTSLGVMGEKIEFSKEVRYYEILLPLGSPLVPEVWATAVHGIDLEISQAHFAIGENEAWARVYLDDGKMQNSYDIKFVKSESMGVILQYDDRYTFTPDYTLSEGEVLTFAVEGDSKNITVDQNGVIKAVGISDEKAVVNAYVGDKAVDSITVNSTIKAVLDVFIVAGQGNAAGEGGNAEESVKAVPGTAYTVELDDRTNSMKDLSEGRQGFTSALGERWYGLTGQKALFIQTAVSDVSITQWMPDGEAFKVAETQIEYINEKLSAEDSFYSVNKTYCLWLHGEWDIANGMSSMDYIDGFNMFYNGLKEFVDLEMMAVIPVRASLTRDGEQHNIEPVCAAQYALCSMNEDVRIITRLTETANIENGMVSAGNLYYTQKGYNDIGKDVAENLFGCYGSSKDRSVRKIEVYRVRHDDLIEYGETVELDKDDMLRTVTVVTPLYANDTVIDVTYDENSVTYLSGGLICAPEGELSGQPTEILFSCGGVELRFNLLFTDESMEEPEARITYTWSFDGLDEDKGQNKLTLSERSAEDGYTLADGVLTSADRGVDFVFEKSISLTSETGWDIEWTGAINDNGILLGNDFSTKGYIFLAPFAQNMGYSVRLVDDEGQTVYIPYGEHTESTRTSNTWRINYTKENNLITLYLNGEVVSSVETDKAFTFTFTNLFGRYGSENVNYCYTGTLDKLSVTYN